MDKETSGLPGKNEKFVYHLLDMDSEQKQVITIPDRTLVKFKGIFFLFVKGNILHSQNGFDVIAKGNKRSFFSDTLDVFRDHLVIKNIESGSFQTGDDFSYPPTINFKDEDIIRDYK